MAALASSPCSSSNTGGLGLRSGFGFGLQQYQKQQQQQGRWGNLSSSARFSVLCLAEVPRLGDAAASSRVWSPRCRGGRMHGGVLGIGVGCMCKSVNADGEASSSDSNGNLDVRRAWDRRFLAAMARIGDLRDMVSAVGRRFHQYMSRSLPASELAEPDESLELPVVVEETEWDRWQVFFNQVEEQENALTVLKFDLEEAIEREDFQEASRLKTEISNIRSNDTVGKLMAEMKVALAEERFADAARMRDETGTGLVGWWAGVSGEGNDPFGKIINIRSCQGRLVATAYSARQLATSSPGVSLFEIFYKEDEELGYRRQAVYLQRERVPTADTPAPTSSEAAEDSKSETDEGDEAQDMKDDSKDSTDQGFSRLMSLLKERMPDIKLKVFHVTTPEKASTDLPKIADQLKSGEDSSKREEEISSSEEPKVPVENQLQEKGRNALTAEELVEMSLKLLIGRLMQNTPEDKIPLLPVRVPAWIDYKSRDNFVFHIEGQTDEKLPPIDVTQSWKSAVSSQASELAAGNTNRVVKVSKEVAEIIRLAVSYAQRRRGLAKSTSFHRIHLPSSSSDSFNGLYVGTLAPHNSQVIQLRPKYGNWQEDDETPGGDKFEFNEYVEAVKLVGDMHVPAGEVIFRAKTGRGCRLPHRGVYPEELGVIARYRGRGKVAEPGFKSPHWIDGELLLLDGKGVGFLNGAQLCFVYSVPGQPYLILFRRAMIEERQW